MATWRDRAAAEIGDDKAAVIDLLQGAPLRVVLAIHEAVWERGTPAEIRYLCRADRYFLLTRALGRRDVYQRDDKAAEWLYRRCREVEAEPDGHLDLWAREHYKSTVITYAGAIQEILRDPEITIGVFAYSNKIAKAFLDQIKREFEANADLQRYFADILWQKPKSEAPKWSRDDGIVVKRSGNPKESTVEAYGLIDGQPTGRHYDLRIYDDVVTRETVSSPEMIKKVTEIRELSDNLSGGPAREWNIGTRYHFGDTYGVQIERGILKPRVYPATDTGLITGKPVFLTEQAWDTKKRKQPSQLAAQLLQNPLAGSETMFKPDWFRPYFARPRTLHVYILVDPSKGSPSRRSDRTGIAVLGLDAGGNYYLLDGYRHRMTLSERWQRIKQLRKKWSGAEGVALVKIGYERYGMQSDLEHFEEMMNRDRDWFPIEEVSWPKDHAQSKSDRVERLTPDLQQSRFFLPGLVYREGMGVCTWTATDGKIVYRTVQGEIREHAAMRRQHTAYRNIKALKRMDEAHQAYDLTAAFIEEATYFPFGPHDDLIDAAARVHDLDPSPPVIVDDTDIEPPVFVDT